MRKHVRSLKSKDPSQISPLKGHITTDVVPWPKFNAFKVLFTYLVSFVLVEAPLGTREHVIIKMVALEIRTCGLSTE
jgi:hypothetical protein